MILKRLATSIRKQDWFTVLIETLIVVFGVFIGLQVNNWNQARLDRADEAVFLSQLHNDIVRVEDSSARLRTRRIGLIEELRGAGRVIFERGENDRLSEAHCLAIVTSHYYNISVMGLPSLTELANAGRVGIIRDAQLRTALVDYQERVLALSDVINRDSGVINNLIVMTPELVRISPVFDTALGEMQTLPVCDLEGMRASQLFLNAFSENIDSYDAYLRDGLLPWNAQLQEVHRLLDETLDIEHAGRDET